MSDDDFDFDDDDDFDLDEEIDDGFEDEDADDLDESQADSADVRTITDSQADAVEETAKAAKNYDPYAPVPFFKNWIWWTSLIAAIPGAILLASIVLGMKDYGGEFNWMMWVVAGLTFFLAAGAAVMPLLLALGFFLGGKEVSVAQPKQSGADDVAPIDDEVDDDDGFETSDFDEDDDEDFDDFDDFDDED